MPTSPRTRRTTRTAFGALGAASLIALGAAPAAFADTAEPHLVMGNIAPISGVQPGGSVEAPVTVTNNGTAAAQKVWLFYSVTHGLDYTDIPSNCEAHQVHSYDEMTAKSNVVCEFDQALEPGTSYAPEKSLPIKALDRALNDELRVSVWGDEPSLDDAATPPVPGTAPAVRLVEKSTGGDATEEAVDVPVTTVNTADFTVTGAQLKGGVGDTVPLKVTFTNAGPAWVLGKQDESVVHVLITPPAGTSVVKPHGYCDAEGAVYSCGTSESWIDEGDSETYTFQLKIDKKVAGATGSVALSSEARPFDPDKANDKADITLDVTGSGSTAGSSGSTGGSGGSAGTSGGATTGGSSGGATGGSGSTGGSGPASTGGSGAATSGGDLAHTGSANLTLPLAGAAVVAVGVGTGAVIVVRRRRAQGRV